MRKNGVAALCLFLKKTEYITSTFDIHDSIFDIRFFKVSFPIRLAVFLASGGARDYPVACRGLPLCGEKRSLFFRGLF
jgi:hypothetical protein